MNINRRVCSKCKTEAVGDEEIAAAFRSAQNTKQKTYRATACNLCIITAHTQAKERDRYLVKAQNTRQKHAKKFGVSVATLRDDLGWIDIEMSEDMKAAHIIPCPECGHAYRSLDDLTLDISDPERSPFYPSNASWMCRTCNTVKSRTPRHLWDARKRYERKWQAQQKRLRVVVQCDLWGGEVEKGKVTNDD